MKKIFSLMLFLGIISAVAGGILSYVNDLTAPIIEEMAIAAEKENLELMFPGAEFKAIEYTDESGLVIGAYEVVGQGYVYKATVNGYNSSTPVIFMIAFDNDGKIVGFKELQQQETNGIGSRVFTDEFKNTVIGKSSADPVATLSGATVTSSAVVKGINACKAIYNNMQGIVVDPNAVAEPVKPTLQTGNPQSLSGDYTRFDAQVEVVSEGVFSVRTKGYGLIDPEGHASESDTTYARNEFEIKITEGAVESIEFKTFGDTPGFGDKANNEDYLAMFNGATLESDVDVVTSATWTSKSVIASVQAALNAANE